MVQKGAKLNPEQLEKLAKARELARAAIQEKKALNAGLNTKGKQLKKELVNNFLKEIHTPKESIVEPEEKIEELEPLEAKPKKAEKEPVPPIEKIPKKKAPKVPVSSDSESEEEVEVVKVRKSKKKPKKKVIYLEESESEEEIEYRRRPRAASTRQAPIKEQSPERVPVRPNYGNHLVHLMKTGYRF